MAMMEDLQAFCKKYDYCLKTLTSEYDDIEEELKFVIILEKLLHNIQK